MLWFDDKNEKLDEACPEATSAFKAYARNDNGLISWKDENNPLMDLPTLHRLVVTDRFALENYRHQNADAMILEDSISG